MSSPEVTVGICAHNEENNIGHLLKSILFEQKLPGDFEVLVVCSGCTDNTVEIVQNFAQKDSRVIPIVETKKTGKANAVNNIFSKAKGKNIIFISADTLPKKDCFSKLLTVIQRPKIGIVCGNPKPINPKNSLVGKLVNFLWSFHGHVFEQLNDIGHARHATGEVFCIRKGIVNKIPADIVNDDAYIALKAKKKNWLIKFEKESQVFMCGPKTFSDYYKQRKRVLFGHHQIKKVTGESPQHLLYLFPQNPKEVIKLLSWAIKKLSISTFLIFALVELVINAIAFADTILGRTYSNWSVAKSTKKIFSEKNFKN